MQSSQREEEQSELQRYLNPNITQSLNQTDLIPENACKPNPEHAEGIHSDQAKVLNFTFMENEASAKMSEEETIWMAEREFKEYQRDIFIDAKEKAGISDFACTPLTQENKSYIKSLEASLSSKYPYIKVEFQADLTLTALDYIVSQGILPKILKYSAHSQHSYVTLRK
jgi:hypothetical protein